ncbi:hypothetical protein AAVH_29806 [Aphelenchoides avenae]|nr:hypothetical protein AAVH_29806 [Aphelenchus avenae]
MDHLDGTYIIGTDDEDNYVAQDRTGSQATVNLGNSRITVTSRRLAIIQRFRQELLPTQPLAATSATAAAATAAGPSNSTATNRAAARQRLSQTLSRLTDATGAEHRQAAPTTGTLGIVRTDSESRRFTPEERAEAENLWNSISHEP